MSLFSRFVDKVLTPDLPAEVNRNIHEAILLEHARDLDNIRDLLADADSPMIQPENSEQTSNTETQIIDPIPLKLSNADDHLIDPSK